MKTKQLKNGDIKVWYENEDDFMIIRKGEPLFDTLIDGNLLTKKYTRILVKDIKEVGFDAMHKYLLGLMTYIKTALRV